MPCANPLKAYRPAHGGPVRFHQPRNGHTFTPIDLPCGQCILCRIEHARQWAVRITHEATLHTHNCFVTLTYNDANLPPHGELNYAHLRNFWKRLRKKLVEETPPNQPPARLRYYAVGEYGDKTLRPHYHACIFGHAFDSQRLILRTTPSLLWTNPFLERIWGLGNVSVGALTFQTAQYTAAYVTKKLNNARRYVRIDETTGELIPLEQPRAFMSLRPAISRNWLETWGRNVYDHDQVVIEGRPQKPPKYYDAWLKKKNEEQEREIKNRRKANAQPLTEKQLHARANNAHARKKQRPTSI